MYCKTLEEVRNSVVLFDCDNQFEGYTPFIFKDGHISGNVFGNEQFKVVNLTEFLVHIANPSLIPLSNLGMFKVTLKDGSYGNFDIYIKASLDFFTPEEYSQFEQSPTKFLSKTSWLDSKEKIETPMHSHCEKKKTFAIFSSKSL